MPPDPRPYHRLAAIAWAAVLSLQVASTAAPASADKASATPKAPAPANSTFSPGDGAYRLSIPAGWSRSTVPSRGAEITLLRNSPKSTFPSLIGAAHAPAAPGEPRDFKGLTEGTKRDFASRLKGLTVESDEDFKLAGEPAKRIVLAGKNAGDGRPLKMALVMTYHGPGRFVFTALAPADEFDAVGADFDKLLKSFTFGPGGQGAAPPGAPAKDQTPADRTRFTSPDRSFTLTYNNRWGVVKDPPEPRVMLLMPAVALQQRRVPTDVPELFVTVEKVGRRPTLDQLEDKALNEFQAVAPDAHVVSSDEAKLGGEPARRVVIEGRGRLGGPQRKSVTVLCNHGDSTYAVGCVGLSDAFDANVQDFDAVLASFRFADRPNIGEADDGKKANEKPPAKDNNELPF